MVFAQTKRQCCVRNKTSTQPPQTVQISKSQTFSMMTFSLKSLEVWAEGQEDLSSFSQTKVFHLCVKIAPYKQLVSQCLNLGKDRLITLYKSPYRLFLQHCYAPAVAEQNLEVKNTFSQLRARSFVLSLFRI